jgi:NADPH:quinone reductase-like Zn-dependent oxidoreductase
MRAIVQDAYGSVDVLHLEDIDRPVIKDTGVLVRVRAASVNPPDWAGTTGIPRIVRLALGVRRPRNRVRGTDVAGIVEAVGAKVTGLKVGDEVYGSGRGTFAEYCAAGERGLARKPANLTFEQAAAVPMSGLTALQALRDQSEILPGQKVLITGAGGGIGTFAVQIAKSFGAEVTGVCGPSKLDLVRSLGADHVIDYTKEDFTRGTERYDFILDNVSNHTLAHLRRVMAPKGTLIPNGGQFKDHRWRASFGTIIWARLTSPFVSQKTSPFLCIYKTDDLDALTELIESGKVRPIVGSKYPLSETAAAIREWGEFHTRGKIVIVV